MKRLFWVLSIGMLLHCSGAPHAQVTQDGAADAMPPAAVCDCLDTAWELHNWTMVLHDGVTVGDLTTDDVEWISRQMDYHAGVFRVCAQ
jgi:hypothetical protein